MFFVCLFGAGAAHAKTSSMDADAGPELITFAEARRRMESGRLAKREPTPAEFLAGPRAESEGRMAYLENRPYTANPYSFETHSYLAGGFLAGWMLEAGWLREKARHGEVS